MKKALWLIVVSLLACGSLDAVDYSWIGTTQTGTNGWGVTQYWHQI